MPNSFYLAAMGPVEASCILLFVLQQCSLNPNVSQGHWLYFSTLATFALGQSLLKKRDIPCIFVAFQRRDLQMYKQYANTVRMLVTDNEQGVLKGTTVTTTFVTANAL